LFLCKASTLDPRFTSVVAMYMQPYSFDDALKADIDATKGAAVDHRAIQVVIKNGLFMHTVFYIFYYWCRGFKFTFQIYWRLQTS
jgi:hypothetical protein